MVYALQNYFISDTGEIDYDIFRTRVMSLNLYFSSNYNYLSEFTIVEIIFRCFYTITLKY